MRPSVTGHQAKLHGKYAQIQGTEQVPIAPV
jgi:hypothetical protein